jgi:hypothetical protein
MITISTHWDVVVTAAAHITATVTVRVVRYLDGIAITEYRAVVGTTVHSILEVLDDRVHGFLVNGE